MKRSLELTELLQTVTSLPSVEQGNAAAGTQELLELRLQGIARPRDWFALPPMPRFSGATSSRRRVRSALADEQRACASLLENLHARMQASEHESSESPSRLYHAIAYYRLALQMAMRTFEPMQFGQGRASALHQVRQLMGAVHKQWAHLVALPLDAIVQFNESDYIATNDDVRDAIKSGALQSGLEHFAVQGVLEAVHGGRPAGGIDLDLIPIDAEPDSAGNKANVLIHVVGESGLFDEVWYNQQYGTRRDALKDYCTRGYLEGRAPNALFDQTFYCERYLDVDIDSEMPLLHYITVGEAEGRLPNCWFDPSWYRKRHGLGDEELALAHFLDRGIADKLDPNALFDTRYYLRKNPDVALLGCHPAEHFYRDGWHEMRNPSATFNTALYLRNELRGQIGVNPAVHYLEQQREQGVETDVKRDLPAPLDDVSLPVLTDIAGNIRHFANPGPAFEEPSGIDAAVLSKQARAIAFYLPQFHAFDENDQWWGKGFSEWRNVARGTPRFAGHYQPRIPRDLGFYNALDEATLRAQCALAKAAGIEAFCYYYYWFDGKRLMDKPLDLFLGTDIDQEFCIMWANENWTRTWDGFDSEVLIEQNYRDADEEAFIADTVRYMSEPRYTRVGDRPLFILYRPGLLPSSKATLARWRARWLEALGVEPVILMVQGFDDLDPREHGLDGAVEFPPHKVCVNTPDINDQLTILDPGYAGHVRDYGDVVARALGEATPDYPQVKTVAPHWDNDARREGRGMTLHGSTPELYERWMRGAISHARHHPLEGESFVFINAWNEWAEGAYLEPDVHFGHAYLNATQRAVHGLTSHKQRKRVLFVGHDAYRHGAQMLLLGIVSTCKQQFGVDVVILLKTGGPLLGEYKKLGRTIVLDQVGQENLPGLLAQEQLDMAITNTCVSGDLVPVLKQSGLRVVSLIHELPNLIAEFKLESEVSSIADDADHVVFPSDIVRRGFNKVAGVVAAEQHVLPQGLYKQIEFSQDARREIRQQLGIAADDKVVLNVGYADLRKGFDIFLQTARRLTQERADVHFIWAGALSMDMERWVKSDLAASESAQRIHLIGFTDRMADYYSASDCLYLTSREDPYPSVVLEAMNLGLPAVVFRDATGFDALMGEYGHVVDRNDVAEIQRTLVQALYNDSHKARTARIDYVAHECRYDDYCFNLLRLLDPSLKKISVVVPNYNYASYMASRLGSVFEQTHPVFETIVLDDHSTDDSLETIRQVAAGANRSIRLVPNESNSGNVFRQWTKGLSLCRGDLVWIAEADDLADPQFLAESVQSFDDNTVFSFTDSAQIDTDDEPLAASYDYYLRIIDEKLFRSDFSMQGPEFVRRALAVRNAILNVSAVLWDRRSLVEALSSVGSDLEQHRLVGDWRLYLEALGQKDARVSFIAESLNVHRRHRASVTGSLDPALHLEEIETMHAIARSSFGTDTALDEAISEYVVELREQFGLPATSPTRLGKAA